MSVKMEMARGVRAGAIAIGLCCLLAGPALAQGSDDKWSFDGFVGFEYQSETDLDRGNGDFEYYMPSFGFKASRKLSDSWTLNLDADHRIIDYDFDLPGGSEPWETIHVFRLNPSLTWMLSDHWLVQGGPIFEFAGENGAERDKAVRGGGGLVIGYVSDGFGIGLGAIVTSDIDDDPYVQPAGFLDWNITDNLSLNLRSDSSRGATADIGYLFFDRLKLSVGYGYRRERFRLDDDGVPGGREDGVGEENAQILKFTAGWFFTEKLVLEIYGGLTTDGEFKLDDEDGRQLTHSDYDDSGFAGVMFRFGW